jgi:ParB family chromosome partitioning protein
VQRRSGLGKGLASLIPAGLEQEPGEAVLRDVPVGAITPNPHQPRTHFDEEALAELTASIQALGVLQPILVRPAGDGAYELVAGERRWRAARRAGLATVPAVVRTTDDVHAVTEALVENLQRQDLNALEEAGAFQQLIEEFGLTHDEVAARVGKSRSAVTNTLRLLQLPTTIQRFVSEGRLSAGHARALLGTPDRAFQEQLARRAVQHGLSVREVEDAVRLRVAGGDAERRTRATPALRPPGLLELEQLLADHLDTRVHLTMGTGKGRLTVDFADLEDLERIYRRITEGTGRQL